MDRSLKNLFFSLLLLAGCQTATAASFMVSNSLGSASISNIDGYENAAYFRLDGSFFLFPQLGFNIFIVDYTDFDYNNSDFGPTASTTNNRVSLALKGNGFGVTGRWPMHPHFQPYARAEYFNWDLEARSLDRTIGKDNGGSMGIAVGAQFPIRRFFGLKAEALRYEDISGADINQMAIGLAFEF